MNTVDIVIIVILALIISAAVISLIRRKKKGCSCGCEGCAMKDKCEKKE